jgi:hypothetical protein
MLATGFDALMDGLWGVAWLFLAGMVARIGTAFLWRAEGIKLNTLKSCELRNRAVLLQGKWEPPFERVFIVPSGKGHLTNAFGMSSAIGKEAADFTREPKVAIRALANLCQTDELPRR